MTLFHATGSAVCMAAASLLAAGPATAASLPELPAGAAYGDFAVGTVTGFAVDDRQRFDPWNAAWAGPEYRALLRRIDESGQTRTVVFQLWYPATPDMSGGRIAGPRSPRPAAGGRRAAHFDLYFHDADMAPQIGAAAQALLPHLVRMRGGGLLAEAGEAGVAEVRRRILEAPLGAWLDAPPAEGRFPLVVLAHGLGGSHGMWASLAEFLASRGYVVAAPTFVSDGGLPLAFHDPDSPFANAASPEELRSAYATVLGEAKVLPYFYRLMFGREASGFEPPEGFDPRAGTVVPGGVERATAMMRNLFRQRVADVGLVVHTVRRLGEGTERCRHALAAMGATTAARELCGRFAGRIDGARVGVAGHSLGAMTAQIAADLLPGVAAALGLNNAPPFSWTPEEAFGAGETSDGLPVGSRKPLLLMIGDEDNFVQQVFIGLFQSAVAAAGGDPAAAFPLAAERAAPDRMENPQPVALSSWRRALADRMLVIVRDTDHSTIADDFARMFPWPEFRRGALPFAPTPERRRKPAGEAAFGPPPAAPGEPFVELGWGAAGAAGAVYLPHVVRDWYARAWFDLWLKDDAAAREELRREDPFGALTSVRRDLR